VPWENKQRYHANYKEHNKTNLHGYYCIYAINRLMKDILFSSFLFLSDWNQERGISVWPFRIFSAWLAWFSARFNARSSHSSCRMCLTLSSNAVTRTLYFSTISEIIIQTHYTKESSKHLYRLEREREREQVDGLTA
jgi:hypothetical protein